MYAGLVTTSFGAARTLCDAMLVAALFYMLGGTPFADYRPEVADKALERYRTAVHEVLGGKADFGDIDKKAERVVASLNPRKHYRAVEATIQREVHAVFDQVVIPN